MNAYFLVEGRRCERKLYPSWLYALAPHLTRVNKPQEATRHYYYLLSAEGYPSILRTHLANAIRDVEKAKVYNYLVVVLDAEETNVGERLREVATAVDDSSIKLNSAELRVIIQNRCIETWLLGNRRILTRQPESQELREYLAHYDVGARDPEKMSPPADFNTHAQFHSAYLRAVFRERNLSYSKSRPGHAGDQAYLEELMRRVSDCPTHLATLRDFLGFVSMLSEPA
jgi:hypothetical protein